MINDGYEILMRPNEAETADHGFHCLGDRIIRMRKVMSDAGFWRASTLIFETSRTTTWFPSRRHGPNETRKGKRRKAKTTRNRLIKIVC